MLPLPALDECCPLCDGRATLLGALGMRNMEAMLAQERAFFGTARALGWKLWCEADKVKVRSCHDRQERVPAWCFSLEHKSVYEADAECSIGQMSL